MGELLTPTHLTLVAAVALILFGGNKLPELGTGLGASLRGFKDGIKGLADIRSSKSKRNADAANPMRWNTRLLR